MTDYTLPPVPHMIAYTPQELERVRDYGHACAEHVRATLLARIAELEQELEVVKAERETLISKHFEQISERDRLRADLAAKAGEVEALRGFAQKVMESWPECGLDGIELEDYAKEFGLIESTRVQGPCGEDCACLAACADWPTDCYHRTALLTGSGPWVNPLAAEVEKLRAASVIEWEPGRSYTAAELLRRAIRGLRVRKDHDLWPAVRNMCGVGSGVAHYLCRWAGRDPETGREIAARKGEGSEP